MDTFANVKFSLGINYTNFPMEVIAWQYVLRRKVFVWKSLSMGSSQRKSSTTLSLLRETFAKAKLSCGYHY